MAKERTTRNGAKGAGAVRQSTSVVQTKRSPKKQSQKRAGARKNAISNELLATLFHDILVQICNQMGSETAVVYTGTEFLSICIPRSAMDWCERCNRIIYAPSIVNGMCSYCRKKG